MTATGEPEMVALALLGLLPPFIIGWAVYSQSKSVAALAQLGSLQGREQTQDAHYARAEASVVEAELSQATAHAIKAARTNDRVCFLLGVLNTLFTAWLAGAAPAFFYLWHTPKAVFLTGLRWYTFKQQGQHYLLYDFCYWANGLWLLYLWVYPSSATLFQAAFVVSNGPLAWSVLAFSQSLVFHEVKHMTSVFIHISPMVLSYALRWHPGGSVELLTGRRFELCDGSCDFWHVSPLSLVWVALSRFYLLWIVGYYVWVFLLLGERIKRRSYQTLYDRVTTSGPASKVFGRLFRLTGTSSDLGRKALYMLTHLAFGVFTMSLATIYFHSSFAHTVFCLAILTSSIWNASGYYFSVFAQRYEKSLASKIGNTALAKSNAGSALF